MSFDAEKAEKQALYQERERPEPLKQLQHMQVDSFFDDYRQNSRWKELAETLIGEEAFCEGPEWFNKPPNTAHPTPPHQDNYYFNLTPPNVLTIWLALDAVDRENGCLRYVRGSHINGARPHSRTSVLGFSQQISDYGEADRQQEVEIHLQPGDVAVHHGWTIHRAEPNSTAGRNRRSFAMVFKGVSCRRDEASFQRYQQSLESQHAQMGLNSK